MSGYTLLSHEPGSKQVPDPELGGTPTQRAMSVPSGLCDPSTSVGSENESLGLNQRAALSELRKYGMQLSSLATVAADLCTHCLTPCMQRIHSSTCLKFERCTCSACPVSANAKPDFLQICLSTTLPVASPLAYVRLAAGRLTRSMCLLCNRVRGASTISEFEDAGNLMTNPSLGFGVSELTTALRQQRPRRAINMLPAVSSAASIQEAGSGAGSSPGITSPFAAVANSPREDANGRPAGETAFEAEQKHQELQQHETAQQPSADAAIGLQAGSDGIDQYSDAVDYQTAELQPDLDKNDESNNVHDVDSGSQQEANMQRTSSSDGSMQNHRRKGRPKCIVM